MTRLSGEGVLESDVSGGGLKWVGGVDRGSPGQPGGGIWDIPLLAAKTQITIQWGSPEGAGPRAPSTSAGSPACLVLAETQPPHPW